MRLRYTAEARGHLAEIFNYLNDRNPIAATQVVARIRMAAERLANFRASATPVACRARLNGSYAGYRISSSTISTLAMKTKS